MTNDPDAHPPPSEPADAGAEDIGYAAALAELDGILRELDGDEVDVDVLGARVRRAAELLRICRSRIASARFEVEQVVAELEADAGSGSGSATGPGTPGATGAAGASET